MFVRPFVALALATLSLAASVPLTKRTGKDNWWSGLETYDAYHSRYMELDCNAKHNSTFFDKCCHPRLKSTDVSTIDEECLGSADCDDDDDNDNSSAPVPAPTATPTPSKAPSPPKASSSSKAPVNVAPAPSSTPADDPAPTHHTTTSKPQPKPTSNPGNGNGDGSSGNVKTGSGKGTYFLQNGVAGACGTIHPDSFHVVALDSSLYGDTSKKSQFCGKTIHITNTDNGKTVDAIVGDACPTCVSFGSVDMSVGTFTEIATEAEGEVNISWVMDL